ncbi:hypothetical protein [Vulcanisaeta sp. JCM 14467]|uniref:hypothetical protein n=1 Tax=Vulcanisaeta sp. JCM 14467 TaxID=1295370 RepID=UPI0020930C71|nr:hypothetical protein [Vulcanisaeta sp. JCM 14467]
MASFIARMAVRASVELAKEKVYTQRISIVIGPRVYCRGQSIGRGLRSSRAPSIRRRSTST